MEEVKVDLWALSQWQHLATGTDVDETWVKTKTQEVEAFAVHINSVDRNMKFTRENRRDNCLPFDE